MWSCHKTLLLELVPVAVIAEYAVLLTDARLRHKGVTRLCSNPYDHLEYVAKQCQGVPGCLGCKEREKERNLLSAVLKSCKEMLQLKNDIPACIIAGSIHEEGHQTKLVPWLLTTLRAS